MMIESSSDRKERDGEMINVKHVSARSVVSLSSYLNC